MPYASLGEDEITIYDRDGYRAISASTYPDGVPLCASSVSWCCRTNITMLLRPKNITTFVAGLFWIDAFHDRHPQADVVLVLPFVPGARQDRLNSEGDWLFTAKSVAGMINARRFAQVVVLDPHSDVTPALIDRCKVVRSHEIDAVWSEFLSRRYDAIVSPDAGAEKRASAFAKRLGIPLIHAWKTRNVSDGKISGFGHEPLPPISHRLGEDPRKLLIVDDICDGGGTFVGLAKTFNYESSLEGVVLDLFVTHGLFSKGAQAVTPSFSQVFCTDSILCFQSGIRTIHVCEQLVRENS
jgi:ribose-phosphate pyrophosphokinase